MRRYLPYLLVVGVTTVVVGYLAWPSPVEPNPDAAKIAERVVVPTFAVGDKVRCHGAGAPWDGRGGVIVAVSVNPEGCHRVNVAGTEHVIPPYHLTPLPAGW